MGIVISFTLVVTHTTSPNVRRDIIIVKQSFIIKLFAAEYKTNPIATNI